MGEHLPCTEGVRGSSPLISTRKHQALASASQGDLRSSGQRMTLGSLERGRTLTSITKKAKRRNEELREVQRLRITWKKLIRAYGGCLGNKSRRRTWYTAKSLGEPCAGANPGISEWGNPRERTSRTTG